MQVYYEPSHRNRLKIEFNGLDSLQGNYSNLCQDLFVLSVLNGKSNGTYLEIGGELPIVGNNTYLLETFYNWKGVSVELNPKYVPMWANDRKNPLYNQDALTTDYLKLLEENNIDKVVDYLSCDIEPQDATFSALKKIDHDKIRFRVITFEHDHYNGGPGPWVRDESRKFLESLGYLMLVGDASHQGNKIEDWWVAPELVDQDRIKILQMNETWNADEAVYKNPISSMIKANKVPQFQTNRINLDQGSLTVL